MGTVMIHCPKTGKAISTGMHIDRAAFRSMPVFFSRTFCPSCRTSHEWFAGEHGSAIPAPRSVTRIARGGPRSGRLIVEAISRRRTPRSCVGPGPPAAVQTGTVQHVSVTCLFILVIIHNALVHSQPAFPSPPPSWDAGTSAAPDVPPPRGQPFTPHYHPPNIAPQITQHPNSTTGGAQPNHLPPDNTAPTSSPPLVTALNSERNRDLLGNQRISAETKQEID